MSSDAESEGNDYAAEVARYTDEELLAKERSKRRRKMGNVAGTVVTAAAATRAPSLWAAAAGSVKSYMSDSSKHKIILQEIERRGLTPESGDLKDLIVPILTGAGSTVLGRAVGGSAGESIGSYAGNLLHSVGNRVLGGSSKDKDKGKKQSTRSPQPSTAVVAAPAAATAAVATVAPPTLQTPSLYNIGPNETPPATLVYHYVPPSAEFPRGYYAPAPPQAPAPAPAPAPPAVVYQAPQQIPGPFAPPQVVYQQPQVVYQQPQTYAPQPPVAYQYAPPQPQYAEAAPAPAPGLRRSATIYEAPPPYQPTMQRAHTIVYRG